MLRRILCIFLFLFSSVEAFEYNVLIEGVQDKNIRNSMQKVSQLFHVNKNNIRGTKTLTTLAQEDVQRLTQAAKYLGYFNAQVSYTLVSKNKPVIIFHVKLGDIFTLSRYTIIPHSDYDVNAMIGQPATIQMLLEQEQKIIDILVNDGYRSASIASRKIQVDVLHHTVEHTVNIDQGERVFLQRPVIHTNGSIKPEKIMKCVAWKPGDPYNKKLIEKTKEALEHTNLFSQISIREDDSPTDDNYVHIEIDLEETPHKTFGIGLGYMTAKGAGITLDFENRNMRLLGEKFLSKIEIWQRNQKISTKLQQHDIFNFDEIMTWGAEYNKQHITPYSSRELSVGVVCDKKLAPHSEGFIGIKLESLRSFSENYLQRFLLIKTPIGLRISTADQLFDPTRGVVLHTKVTPSYQMRNDDFSYVIHTTSIGAYISPPTKLNWCTFAAKATLGNIFGAARNTIPIPDRFFGGSDSILRGYRYQTVSPLDKKRHPIGGRSLLAFSVEARLRPTANCGMVFFYDIGNVYQQNTPNVHKKQLASWGIGGRYTTPIGPLRLDIGFPLNRRHKIDAPFQVYFSIGHSF